MNIFYRWMRLWLNLGLQIALLGLLSGCITMDTLSYLREHKGEGSRVAMLGSETELMDDVVRHLEPLYITTREPHVVLATYKDTLSYGFYFYPSPLSNHTDVEVIYITKNVSSIEDPKRLEHEADAFFDKFSPQYLDKKLLKEGSNKILREGAANKLRAFAHIANRKMSLQLIEMGADVDLAIKKNTSYVNDVSGLLEYGGPGARKLYNDALLVPQFLTELKGEPERVAKRKEAERVEEVRFQAALRDYLAAPIKPLLPESARKYKVQAESAVSDKNFAEAALLFRQALENAPWWPEGHFNLALILGETQEFDTAITEMKRYLALVPGAPNARAAQDKIYVWERKAGEGH